MLVKIVSGNEAGTVKDLPRIEAEVALDTGYAVPVEMTAAAALESPADAPADAPPAEPAVTPEDVPA